MSLLGHLPPNLTWIKPPLSKTQLPSLKLTPTPIFAPTTYQSHAVGQPGVAAVASQKGQEGGSCDSKNPVTWEHKPRFHLWQNQLLGLSSREVCVWAHILQICVISYLGVRFGGRSPGPGIPHPNTGSVKALPSNLSYFLLCCNITIDCQIFMVL